MPAGRPTAYKPEYVDQAAKLCALGATDDEIADFFGVTRTTIYRWKIEHEEFCNAIKSAKEAANERVERSLYQKAVGYTFDTVKIFQHQGEVINAPYREHVPPDTTAAIFWLKNRRKESWRDKFAIGGADDMPPIQVAAIELVAVQPKVSDDSDTDQDT